MKKSQQQIFRRQPIMCPWITSQPYHSSTWHKNRNTTNQNDPLLANNNHWGAIKPGIQSKSSDKVTPSIQQSSSQFFYFLRLMQLFPETHPATLHTVLNLCKNDFFCAVDKLLYAKRCRLLCYKKNTLQKSCNPQTAGMKGNLDSPQNFTVGGTDTRQQSQNNPLIEKGELQESSPNNLFSEKPADLSTFKINSP